MGCELTALVILGFATQGWILFALAPLFALGGMPALQSLTRAQLGPDQQGQLQGVLASLVSLAAVFGPLVFSLVYLAHAAAGRAWSGWSARRSTCRRCH